MQVVCVPVRTQRSRRGTSSDVSLDSILWVGAKAVKGGDNATAHSGCHVVEWTLRGAQPFGK